MKWITNLFRFKSNPAISHGSVVFLYIDLLTNEEIEKIKQRMTPVFVKFSGHQTRAAQMNNHQAVTKSVS